MTLRKSGTAASSGLSPHVRTKHPASIHEVPGAIPGVRLDMWQTGPEQRRWSITEARLSDVVLLSGQMAAPYAANLSAHAAAIFVLCDGGPWLINGRRVNSGDSVLFAPGAEIGVAAAGPCIWYGLQMSAEQLQRYTIAFSGKPMPVGHGVSNLGMLTKRQLNAFGSAISAAQSSAQLALDSPARTPHASVPGELIRLLTRTAQAEDRPLRWGHERIVRQAMAYLREHEGSVLSTADLCLATGISDRWLRESFLRVYGMTFTRLLRLRRLNQARQALLRARVSVTEAANAHGFFDLGRFAHSYRRLFGESPSATVGRHKRRPIARRHFPIRAPI